ncbi:hypothetical protein [Pseudomonas sp. Leaf58]|uniref:hypothetical protein n=1 Tax=Pseudomonas sp. Leaf58 TaxID=1736226 RepID=UPI0012E74A1B|nr:hypothetical protein [Pseudomonas sp. Leaf58]
MPAHALQWRVYDIRTAHFLKGFVWSRRCQIVRHLSFLPVGQKPAPSYPCFRHVDNRYRRNSEFKKMPEHSLNKGSWGKLNFNFDPAAWGSLVLARPGDFIDMVTFDHQRVYDKVQSSETQLSRQGNFLTLHPANAAVLDKQRITERELSTISRQQTATFTYVQLYASNQTIAIFDDKNSRSGQIALAATSELLFNSTRYKIDFRYINAFLDEVTHEFTAVYWDIYLVAV